MYTSGMTTQDLKSLLLVFKLVEASRDHLPIGDVVGDIRDVPSLERAGSRSAKTLRHPCQGWTPHADATQCEQYTK